MISKVDYFSFTYYVYEKPAEIENRHLMTTLLDHLPDHIKAPTTLEFAPARRGFRAGLNIGNHTFVWINRAGLVLVEHTGVGCQHLVEIGILNDVISGYANRATRIDIASDILTETMPAEFVEKSEPERTRASGHQTSESGETFYIGSRKSDRTCKVYRYFPPHPRSAFLRIEYTYRQEQAKIIAGLLSDHSIQDIAVRSGERYQWQHECYKPDLDAPLEEIRAWRPERRQGKTIRWLYSQVVPAVARLHKENALDVDEFINRVREAINDNPTKNL